MDDFPRCFGRFNPQLEVCRVCYASDGCRREQTLSPRAIPKVTRADPVEGAIAAADFHLGYTLASGQMFRWGRDVDGWWKGIACGTAFHLRQEGNRLCYRASADRVVTYAGEMPAAEFLRWYLRIDEAPKVRVSRKDPYLRKARDLLRGFRFARQEPFECAISYVLSVQAHMTLTKKRINFLARILGKGIEFMGEKYWTFPDPEALADLNGRYFRRHRFGWRSERVPVAARYVAEALTEVAGPADLAVWREVVDGLRARSGTGVGLKVSKCIALFSLERLDAVPVDTWVRKFAQAWYGVGGSDAAVCAWAEARGGKWAGYMNEYLFAYYRELNGPSIFDRVISFCASDEPSAELPFERV